MRSSTVAKILLILGLMVGGAAGLALALGLSLAQLPPWMITVGMYKLAFIAAGGLFVAGALLGRSRKNRRPQPEIGGDAEVTHKAVAPGVWEEPARSRQADRLDRNRRQ